MTSITLAVLFVGASLLPPHPGTQLPVTGWATYYNPGIFERVVANRERWGQIDEDACPECIGYAALLEAAKNALDWFNRSIPHEAESFLGCDEITTQLDSAIAAADPDFVC